MKEKELVNLKSIFWVGAAAILIMIIISSYAWPQIPSGTRVCTHWNAAGDCDGYGSKFMGLFLMPIISAATIAFISLMARFEPRASNLAKSGRAFSGVVIVTILFLLVMHTILMLKILGYTLNLSSLMPFLVGLLFVFIGFYMGKVQSNFMFGIRTPWTLSSNLAWYKTHKFGGKLWVVQGMIFIAASFFISGEIWVYLLLGCVIITGLIMMVYSYLIWKKDPDRIDL